FTNLLHLYSPDVLVVGGGIANGLDLMLPTIEATIRQRAMRAYRDVPVVQAQLGRHAGLVGAASLVLFDDGGTLAARMPVGPSTFPDTPLSKTGTV
ncbi:ROK family protein, partial [Mesorhizobium sp. M7A.F.Ca.CA.001.10.2.1]